MTRLPVLANAAVHDGAGWQEHILNDSKGRSGGPRSACHLDARAGFSIHRPQRGCRALSAAHRYVSGAELRPSLLPGRTGAAVLPTRPSTQEIVDRLAGLAPEGMIASNPWSCA
jgi:hypothetical protein